MGGSVALWLVFLPHHTEQIPRSVQLSGAAGRQVGAWPQRSDQVSADIRVWFSLL